MKRLMAMMSMAAMLTVVGCGEKNPQPSEGSVVGFALSFFQKANQAVPYNENLILSPYSAGVALSMLAEGAEGQTRAELDDALNACIFKAEDLGSNDILKVASANSLWAGDNFSIRNHYVNVLQKDYDAFVTTQNFSDPAAVKAINNWCSENTEGKITEIIDRLGSNDVMVLLNALYFKAPWKDAFDPELTHKGVFHGPSADQEVSMMYRRDKFNYAEYQGCQMIQLPYNGGSYSMYVVLPAENMDINSVLPYISESMYQSAMSMLSTKEVIFRMPKFKLETEILLNETLEKLGVETAFNGAADFRGIAATGNLVLSQVKQKCYIDVTEEGTEAAAVTSVQVRMTSVNRDPVARMTVDRPFLFFIQNSETGNILFLGKVVEI